MLTNVENVAYFCSYLFNANLTLAILENVTYLSSDAFSTKVINKDAVVMSLTGDGNTISTWLERFSFVCRKTKVITLTNHNSRKQSNEPIRARSKYMSPVSSAGKRVRASHDWFWFYF